MNSYPSQIISIMSTVIIARNGQEEKWLEERLSALAIKNEPIDLSFGCEFGETIWSQRQEERKLRSRIDKPISETEKNMLQEHLARMISTRERTRIPILLDTTGENIGTLLTRFRIGHGEKGHPGGAVSAEQWCSFVANCPNLEDLVLVSCYDANDTVVEALKNHRKLRKLVITGTDKISGTVTNAIIDRLCSSRCNSDENASVVIGDDSALEGASDVQRSEGRQMDQPSVEYFPVLRHLILTDQSSISMGDFEKMKSQCLDIRFRFGRSGGYTMVANMLGYDADAYFDTHPVTAPQISDLDFPHWENFYEDDYEDFFGGDFYDSHFEEDDGDSSHEEDSDDYEEDHDTDFSEEDSTASTVND